MYMSVEVIGPEKAREYLQNNTKNRKLNWDQVQYLAGLILQGKFVLTHQGIAFDSKGLLIDGQHRLAAIIEAGMEVQVWVARGMSGEIVSCIDTNRPRHLSDTLTIMGQSCTKQQVAITRCLWSEWCYRRWGCGWGQYKDTKCDTTVFMEFYRLHLPSIEFALDCKKTKGLTQSPIFAGIACAWYSVDRNRLAIFRDSLQSGVIMDHSSDTAVLRLRDCALRSVNGFGLSAQFDLYRRTVTAISAFMEGRNLSKLYAGKEAVFHLPPCDHLRPAKLEATEAALDMEMQNFVA